MRARPVRLNTAIGSLLVVGSACFVLGSVPAFFNTDGGTLDGVTYQSHSYPWRIAWLNMVGSILFMSSAVAAYVLPGAGDPVSVPNSVAGTLLGAVCFLVGAVLLFPAWRTALTPSSPQQSR